MPFEILIPERELLVAQFAGSTAPNDNSPVDPPHVTAADVTATFLAAGIGFVYGAEDVAHFINQAEGDLQRAVDAARRAQRPHLALDIEHYWRATGRADAPLPLQARREIARLEALGHEVVVKNYGVHGASVGPKPAEVRS